MSVLAQPTLSKSHRGASARRVPLETLLFAVLTLLALSLIGLGIPLPPPSVQVVVLAVLVGGLGLPHGALDPLIARRAGLWRRPLGFVGFNLGYLLLVVAVVAVWFAAPGPSLAFFLLVSGIHFGADWNAGRSLWLRIPPGLALLTLPAWVHHDEVAAIYRTLAGSAGVVIATVQSALGLAALSAMLLGAAMVLRSHPHQALELVLTAALATFAPPLIFFVIYFCALHSVRHLTHGFRVERAESARRTSFARRAKGDEVAASDRRPVPWPVIITIVYTLGPILAVAALWSSFDAVSLGDRMTQLVFIGLAALTVPHMVVVAAETLAGRRGAPGSGAEVGAGTGVEAGAGAATGAGAVAVAGAATGAAAEAGAATGIAPAEASPTAKLD